MAIKKFQDPGFFSFPGICAAFIAIFMTLPQVAFSIDSQSLDLIHNSVFRFVKSSFDSSAKIDVTIGLTDHRLQLQRCDKPLQVSWSQGAKKVGHTSVRVHCDGNVRWTLFVPVTIKLFREIMVASNTLTRGKELQASDYDMQERDIGTFVNGYITSPHEFHGYLIKRSIRLNQVITPYMLQVPKLVNRGERVTILAVIGSLSVRSTGVALDDGIEGETIRIRNPKSRRIVEGQIVSPGVVRIRL